MKDHPIAFKPHLGIFVGAVTALTFLAIIVVMLVRKRAKRTERSSGDVSDDNAKDKYSTVSEEMTTNKNVDSSDPDLIPLRDSTMNLERTDVIKKKTRFVGKCLFSNANRTLYHEKRRKHGEYRDTISPERLPLNGTRSFKEDNGGFSDEELLFKRVTRPRTACSRHKRQHLKSLQSKDSNQWSDDEYRKQTDPPGTEVLRGTKNGAKYQCDRKRLYREEGPTSKTLSILHKRNTARTQYRNSKRNPKTVPNADIKHSFIDERNSFRHLCPEMQRNSCPHGNYRMSTPV
ncbi:uncharacterized protein LOC143248148 [Tachypleus tridentatus]|uniref:uncharacterized protein LOC143248148 n=1 Tax=Tachypleus tridentatus TaxID=6853 RepID=UPI003FD2FD71